MANASKIILTSGDAPATPASGTVAMYSKADKKYYIKDDSGTETAMVGVDGASGMYTVVSAAKYTATPASTSSITMSDTSDCAVGKAVRYKYGGSTYYGRIKTVTTNTSIAIQGAALNTGSDLTELAVGGAGMASQSSYFVSGAYGDGTTTSLLYTDMKTKEKWLLPKAYLVYFELMHQTVATVTQPKANVLVNAQRVSTNDSNLGVQLSTAGTFVGNSDIAVNTSYYDINPGEELEIEVTGAGNSTTSALNLTAICYWVFE